LRVRREIAARDSVLLEPNVKPQHRRGFDAEELRLLDYFVERQFRKEEPRTAASFRTYRQLGAATQTFSHSHEALKRLLDKNVLAPLPFSTQQLPAEKRSNTTDCWHWYGINLNFGLWPPPLKRPEEFWEQGSLPDEFADMLRETFIEISACGSTPVVASAGTDRDAGSVSVPNADKGGPEMISPGRPTSCGDSKSELPQPQQNPQWLEDLRLLKQALAENRPVAELQQLAAELEARTAPGDAPSGKVVPPQGTKLYPAASCTPGGYATNTNNDAEKPGAVPPQGTYPHARAVASLALEKKAKLAMPSVPREGTVSPAKVTEAWSWLQKVDSTGGLLVQRFAERWRLTCELYPNYVLNRLRGAFEEHMRRVEKKDPTVEPIEVPLGWLSAKARDDGRMERFKRKR